MINQFIKFGVPAWLMMFLGSCLTGCKSQSDNLMLLQTLQQGKAKGHVQLQSGGKIGGGANTVFWGGATDSNLSFYGEIDFEGASFPPIELSGKETPPPTPSSVPTGG